MICRQPVGRPSAGSRPVQSRVPRSGFERRYAAIAPFASSLNDASTAHEEEAASTLTLLPKQRGREQAGGCQLLRFVAFLRGQSDILGSRSLVAGPCRIHASPRPPNLHSTDADHATPSVRCQAGRVPSGAARWVRGRTAGEREASGRLPRRGPDRCARAAGPGSGPAAERACGDEAGLGRPSLLSNSAHGRRMDVRGPSAVVRAVPAPYLEHELASGQHPEAVKPLVERPARRPAEFGKRKQGLGNRGRRAQLRSGRGSRRPAGGPHPGGNRVRRCHVGGRTAACPGPGRSRPWPGRAR